MKAVITNRIYLDATSSLMEMLSKELTYKIQPKVQDAFPEIIKNFNRISPTMCSIPSGRLDLIPAKHEIIDKRVLVPVEFPKFLHTLRPSQQEIHDEIDDCCIINAPTSWGKTFTGIAIAAKLSQKTLVVVHTTMLRDQWAKQVEFTLGIKPGIIGGGKFNIDSPIVIANIQTLTKHTLALADRFGTVILDEAHHCPATTFTNILDKFKSRYKIGLTGTLERKDKKHIIFSDYFGKKIFKPERENSMTPHVLLVHSHFTLPYGKHWADRITELEVHNEHYQKMIADLASNAASKGHKVLVVASRTDMLKKCVDFSTRPAAYITGEIKSTEERMRLLSKVSTGELEIIYGTLSIFSEGISENSLSCVILATPINNDPMLTQLIGRIIRLQEGKLKPLIIDIVLKGPTPKNQAEARRALYLKNGYDIKILKN